MPDPQLAVGPSKRAGLVDTDDEHEVRPLRRPHWAHLCQREGRPGPVIVREVRGQDASQVPLVENDDMVHALAANRADESLREGILPRALRGAVMTSAIPMPFTRWRNE